MSQRKYICDFLHITQIIHFFTYGL